MDWTSDYFLPLYPSRYVLQILTGAEDVSIIEHTVQNVNSTDRIGLFKIINVICYMMDRLPDGPEKDEWRKAGREWIEFDESV